jgi:hypothetical protein
VPDDNADPLGGGEDRSDDEAHESPNDDSDDDMGLEAALRRREVEREQEEAMAEHSADRLLEAADVFQLFGEDWCTYDLHHFMMRHRFTKNATEELIKLVNKWGINNGHGVHNCLSSRHKLDTLLDDNPHLPFYQEQVRVPGLPGDYNLLRRDISEVLEHIFATKDFRVHMDLRPRWALAAAAAAAVSLAVVQDGAGRGWPHLQRMDDWHMGRACV